MRFFLVVVVEGRGAKLKYEELKLPQVIYVHSVRFLYYTFSFPSRRFVLVLLLCVFFLFLFSHFCFVKGKPSPSPVLRILRLFVKTKVPLFGFLPIFTRLFMFHLVSFYHRPPMTFDENEIPFLIYRQRGRRRSTGESDDDDRVFGMFILKLTTFGTRNLLDER